MADAPKHNPLAGLSETSALYYFPEIPNALENGGAATAKSGRFVGLAQDSSGDTKEAPKDAEQVRVLIEEAFNRGKEQGRAEMIADQQDAIDRAVGALQQAMAEMERIQREEEQCKEQETVRLAMAIARKVIGHCAAHEEAVKHVVAEAMQKVADPRQLTLRVHPDDMATVGALRSRLQTGEDANTGLQVTEDASIQRGGCVIETSLGDVDARIDQQIEIIEALLANLLPTPADKG